jgi:hypothetical protein
MTFVAPWALVGLLAAAIPILLHLVQRREPPERAFPAVQYLQDATREHRRRLRFRHWLLLLCRTLLIVALVLAAAGPLLRRTVPLGRHAPTAMVLVIDNSASSAAVVDGAPLVSLLAAQAREVLGRATPADRLWLVLADGVARPGSATELLTRLDSLQPLPGRLDLGAAVRQGRELIRGSGRTGEVVILTDAQRTAVSPAADGAALVVLRPEGAAPMNRALSALDAGAQPWGPDGGRVDVSVSSDDTAAVPVSLEVDGQPRRDALVTPGVSSSLRLPSPPTGWRVLRTLLPPDELRLDDERSLALRIAPPAEVNWDPSDRFLSAALDVLSSAGRLRAGGGVRVGGLGGGASIVVPPEDPALLGALNRSLAARGSTWRYAAVRNEPVQSDSGALLPERVAITRRVALEASSSPADTLATVGGAPWIVRSGNLVLLGSRFDPAWTDLPIRAGFVPLLDALTTRTVRGEPVLPEAAAGAPMPLPPRTTAISAANGEPTPVEGGAPWRPPTPGVYWLLEGRDTLGAVTATLDARESRLARATDGELEAAWPGIVVASLSDGATRTFTTGGRGDLRPLLLVLALLCVVGESLLAGGRRTAN